MGPRDMYYSTLSISFHCKLARLSSHQLSPLFYKHELTSLLQKRNHYDHWKLCSMYPYTLWLTCTNRQVHYNTEIITTVKSCTTQVPGGLVTSTLGPVDYEARGFTSSPKRMRSFWKDLERGQVPKLPEVPLVKVFRWSHVTKGEEKKHYVNFYEWLEGHSC